MNEQFVQPENPANDRHPAFTQPRTENAGSSNPTPSVFCSTPVLVLTAKIALGRLKTGNVLSNSQY
jgi:hypothetical protein